VQRGQGETLKRSSLPPGLDPADLDLATALALLALPREVGRHPETGQPIEAGINRYGPYVKHDRFVRLGPEDDVLTLGMNRAMALLAEAGTRQRAAAKQLKDLGAHPKDRKPVTLHQGRYGPYVRHGKDNASLRKAQDPEQLTLEQAVELLAERAGKSKAKGRTARSKGAPTSASAAKSPGRAAGKGAGKAGKGPARGATRRVTST
jgi:DNA topoisomerase-1